MSAGPLSAEVLDERPSYTLGGLCRACGVSAELIIDLVDEGVLRPHGREPLRWRFGGICVSKVHTVLRLQRDLDLNLAGAALTLELLEELEALRRRVRLLERRF